MKTLFERFETYGLNKVLTYVDSDYEKNFPKILDWLDYFDQDKQYSDIYQFVRNIITDPGNCWNAYLKSVYRDLDKETRRMFLENFVVNATIIGRKKQKEISEKENCNVPWAILLDPTSACNLKCNGCWSAEYGHTLSMSLSTINKIITEGKELGIYMFIYSGGEPLVRKKDIITLCEEHPDCVFMAFTNGTLIDKDFADEIKRVRNFVPAISIEGFEEYTDSRRGKGTYQKVIRAMEILKERRLLFGISTCYTAENVYEVGSSEYIDAMIEHGAKFCWYFTYMPIGTHAPTNLMVSPEQREFMYQQVRLFRKEKPIFLIDFWNDGEYIGGCIAGGRHYLHINANGDVEPCAFIHYSNVNVKNSSLLDALKSPLFMEYRRRQPFNENHLRPCPLLDNQGVLAEMVKSTGAYSTEIACPEDVDFLCKKCAKAAEHWAKTSERIWINSCVQKKNTKPAELIVANPL